MKFFFGIVDRKNLNPLQQVYAPEYRSFIQWYAKGFHEVMFDSLLIEDFEDCPFPLEKLNKETQYAVMMFEGHQQYSEILRMPIELRHELVKAIFRMNKKKTEET